MKTVAGGLTATALPLCADTKLNVGVGTYSYHNLSMDKMIVRLKALHVGEIEMSRGGSC
jgi:inosose dehydratase